MVPLTPVVALLLASVPFYASAQNTVSSLYGTWSSGSMKVATGAGFANPSNESFIYPNCTGISYSFAEPNAAGETWYEIARYRFTSNGTQPNCITAVMNWVHGTYALQPNGSIVLTPNGDGYQQIQDPCAAVSNFIENYNDTELIPNYWYPYTDTTLGSALQLYAFDGTPLAPVYVYSTTPTMLPTQQLRNVTAATNVLSRRGNGAVGNMVGGWRTLASTAVTVAAAALVL